MDIVKKYFCNDTIENFGIIDKIPNKIQFNFSTKKIQNILDKLNYTSKNTKTMVDKINIQLKKLDNVDLDNNIFISPAIKKQSKNINYKYEIKIDELNLTTNLYVPETKDIINLKIFIDLYMWLSSFKTNNKQPINKQPIIDLYLLPNKKLLDDSCCLGPNHVNSGSTSNRSYIQIWRKEEMFKVFIHELIHLFSYGFVDNRGIAKKSLKDKINIDKNCLILPNEAYVDTWAIILNSLYLANRLKLKDMFQFILKNEIYFCMYQTAKIIKHYGFTKFDDLFDKNHPKEIKQGTSVFSYYIIKSSLLFNFDKFMDFTQNFDFINFKETNQNLEKFNELIIHCLTDRKFKNEVNRIIPFVQNSTLRMSLFQLYD